MTELTKNVELDRWKLAKSWSYRYVIDKMTRNLEFFSEFFTRYFSTLPVEFTHDMGIIGKLSARTSEKTVKNVDSKLLKKAWAEAKLVQLNL